MLQPALRPGVAREDLPGWRRVLHNVGHHPHGLDDPAPALSLHADEGWTELFNGEDLSGWRIVVAEGFEAIVA